MSRTWKIFPEIGHFPIRMLLGVFFRRGEGNLAAFLHEELSLIARNRAYGTIREKRIQLTIANETLFDTGAFEMVIRD